jgi:hypothetical protein
MPVVIALVAFAYLAALYLSIVCVTWPRSAPQGGGTAQGRRNVVYTSPQGAERHGALTQRETIVGVEDTARGMCFFIGTVMKDERNTT